MPKPWFLTYLYLLVFTAADAQNHLAKNTTTLENPPANTHQQITWWNLLHYTIALTPDYHHKSISGTNTIEFVALQTDSILRISLQAPMQINKVAWKSTTLTYKLVAKDIYEIHFPRAVNAGEQQTIVIEFAGVPQQAKNPPFDSGWIWEKDEKGRPWMSIACEGSGASIWLPCKDVLYDEPDLGATISITVPDTLVAVANGRLQKQQRHNKWVTYTWAVVNPINNYNIIPYIGKYVNWHQNYAGAKGKLDCDFWVLDYNLARAKRHLQQTDTMLHAFEYWLGPYPFYEDGYKLVEALLPGMEHQSAIAYGNGYQNGYKGKDFISNSGWGLKWDFMLVHESGHEWFGNSLTAHSYGDSWIHEGFTKYLETIYTDAVFGKEAGNEYALGTWKRIKNDVPILGNNTTDTYYKASAMLHAMRQIMGDSLFRGWLKGLQQKFYHQTISTAQVLDYTNQYTQHNFSKVFFQYLQTTQVPIFEYSFERDILHYRWTNCVDRFDMPLKISTGNKAYRLIYPTNQWQQEKIVGNVPANFTVDKNFYIQVKRANK